MDEVRKPINSVCYIPSSEPYKIYFCISISILYFKYGIEKLVSTEWIRNDNWKNDK
jgi:hypothetical protein